MILRTLARIGRSAGVSAKITGVGRGWARAARREGEVLVDAAGQVAQPAVAEHRDEPVADALEEVAVVRDHEQRAGPAVEQVLERGERLDVEVVGRLVEQQHVRLGHQQAHQLQPAPLAAGQVADRRPLPLAGEAEPLEQLARASSPCPCRA